MRSENENVWKGRIDRFRALCGAAGRVAHTSSCDVCDLLAVGLEATGTPGTAVRSAMVAYMPNGGTYAPHTVRSRLEAEVGPARVLVQIDIHRLNQESWRGHRHRVGGVMSSDLRRHPVLREPCVPAHPV